MSGPVNEKNTIQKDKIELGYIDIYSFKHRASERREMLTVLYLTLHITLA